MTTIDRSGIAGDLVALGIEPGDEVVVHSSLSSLGWVEGGADAVVDALVEAVGDAGTVVVPTFTPNAGREAGFDVAETPSETGAVTEALRSRPGAERSRHPTHSVAALGPGADAITADHAFSNPLGPDSPLHRVAERGGKILLLGVGNERNSTIHVAEAIEELPYKEPTEPAYVRDGDGGKREVESSVVGSGSGFPKLDPVAECEGVFTRGSVGEADATLMRGAEILRVARAVLRDHPDFLLCHDPGCWWCPGARRRLYGDESD